MRSSRIARPEFDPSVLHLGVSPRAPTPTQMVAGPVEQPSLKGGGSRVVGEIPRSARDFAMVPVAGTGRSLVGSRAEARCGDAQSSNQASGTSEFEAQSAIEETNELLDQEAGILGATAPAVPSGNIAAAGGGVAAAALTPTVTFTRVRATNTPAAMGPDRITPRIDFAVVATVTNWQVPMAPIAVTVDGSGGSAGTVTIDGNAAADISASGTMQLRGTVQTAPGSVGGLHLVAHWGGRVVGAGNAFSVAAIPQNMVLNSSTAVTGTRRGIAVTQSWSSDSGTLADLDEAQQSEVVEYISNSGVFVGLGSRNSGYMPATRGTVVDTHGTPVSALTGPGARLAHQTKKFLDNRTGVVDVPMNSSGFTITRTVAADAAGALFITTAKVGAAVTANGITSGAGSGNQSLTQRV